jgi:hypothetical protein
MDAPAYGTRELYQAQYLATQSADEARLSETLSIRAALKALTARLAELECPELLATSKAVTLTISYTAKD